MHSSILAEILKLVLAYFLGAFRVLLTLAPTSRLECGNLLHIHRLDGSTSTVCSPMILD